MKRDLENVDTTDDALDNDGKRPRQQNKLEVRLLIPSKIAGTIIGKSGANVKELRTNNNAKIRIPDCKGPERIMVIQTDNVKGLNDIIQQTFKLIAEDKLGADSKDGVPADSSEIRILIHQSIVGGVIGKGGLKIKEIREASGANMKVYGTCAPQSTDRCIAIKGTYEKIGIALSKVVDIQANTEVKGHEISYDPYNFDGVYAQEYGGYGSEKDLIDENVYGGNIGLKNFDFDTRDERIGTKNRNHGYESNTPIIPPFQSKNVNAMNLEDTGPVQTTKVSIPKDIGGAIIGPGGSRIRKIRSDSNAGIKISDVEPGAKERIITISGTTRNINIAQYLLQQCVKEFST